MKNLVLISILSALSLVAMAQDESTTASNNAVTITGRSIIRLPDSTYPMDRAELNKFKGSYDLPDGKTLSLFSERGVLYAQVEGQPRHEVVATTPDTFVAKDQQMKLILDQEEDTNQGNVITGKLYTVVSHNHANNNVSSN